MVVAAAVLAVVPPLMMGGSFLPWIQRALTFLVISCPCALVISIPLSFFGGIGGASKCGILIKGSNYLEALAQVTTVVFDKTGTLTQGSFEVTAIHPEHATEQELLGLAALVESYSDHPISLSLKKAWGKELDSSALSQVEEIAGHGVVATVGGKRVAAGNCKLMAKLGVQGARDCELAGTAVHVAVDGVYQGLSLIHIWWRKAPGPPTPGRGPHPAPSPGRSVSQREGNRNTPPRLSATKSAVWRGRSLPRWFHTGLGARSPHLPPASPGPVPAGFGAGRNRRWSAPQPS